MLIHKCVHQNVVFRVEMVNILTLPSVLAFFSLTQHVATQVGLICAHFGGVAALSRAPCNTYSLHVVLNNTLWLLTHWTDFVHCWGWLSKSRPLFLGVTGLGLVTRWSVCSALLDGHTFMSCLIRAAVLYEGDFHIPVRGLLQLLLWSSPSSW